MSKIDELLDLVHTGRAEGKLMFYRDGLNGIRLNVPGFDEFGERQDRTYGIHEEMAARLMNEITDLLPPTKKP